MFDRDSETPKQSFVFHATGFLDKPGPRPDSVQPSTFAQMYWCDIIWTLRCYLMPTVSPLMFTFLVLIHICWTFAIILFYWF